MANCVVALEFSSRVMPNELLLGALVKSYFLLNTSSVGFLIRVFKGRNWRLVRRRESISGLYVLLVCWCIATNVKPMLIVWYI